MNASKNHHPHCTYCDVEFIGSVSFVDVALELFHAPLLVSLSKDTQYFTSADYLYALPTFA